MYYTYIRTFVIVIWSHWHSQKGSYVLVVYISHKENSSCNRGGRFLKKVPSKIAHLLPFFFLVISKYTLAKGAKLRKNRRHYGYYKSRWLSKLRRRLKEKCHFLSRLGYLLKAVDFYLKAFNVSLTCVLQYGTDNTALTTILCRSIKGFKQKLFLVSF